LPKVYGEEDNAELLTVYMAKDHPQWRWTHGYVENVAAAIALAAVHPAAGGHTYNVGEEQTPTIAERLAQLPPPPPKVICGEVSPPHFDFSQDIVYDTSRIRQELGYREVRSEAEAMRAVVEGSRRK
jgi:nucleoside-diphosphate-sugar epimerase